MESGYYIDESQWPLVAIARHGLSTEDQDVALLERMEAYLRRRTSFGLLVDIRDMTVGSGRTKWERFGLWLREHEGSLERYCVGSAFVLQKPEQRAVINAIRWVNKIPNEYAIVSEMEAALAWLKPRLRPYLSNVRPPLSAPDTRLDRPS